jgi:hypothetical protein
MAPATNQVRAAKANMWAIGMSPLLRVRCFCASHLEATLLLTRCIQASPQSVQRVRVIWVFLLPLAGLHARPVRGSFFTRDKEAWSAAFAKLLPAIADGNVEIIGRQNGLGLPDRINVIRSVAR